MRNAEVVEVPYVSEELAGYRRIDALEALYPLHSAEYTLGHEAVLLMQKQAAIIGEMSLVGEDDESYNMYGILEKSLRNDSARETSDARDILRAVSNHNEQYLDRYLNAEAVSSHMGTMLKLAEIKAGHALSWKEWLVDHASNEELLSFLQYHNYVIEQQQTHPDVQALTDHQKALFTAAVNKLEEAGVLIERPTALDVASIRLVASDIFQTTMKERTGYYEPGTTAIHIEQGYEMGPRGRLEEFCGKIAFIATHELVHATVSESYRQYDSAVAARWINEAITEELSYSIDEYSGLEDLDNIYVPERRLLKLLLGKGDLKLGYTLAYRAFSGTYDDRKEFMSYIDMLWGVDSVLEKVNHALSLEESSVTGPGGKPTRAIETLALTTVYEKLIENPSALLVQYEDAVKTLTAAAKEKGE